MASTASRSRSVRWVPGAWVLAAACLLSGRPSGGADAAPEAVSFHRQIRPILQASCQGCHQPAKAEGGYVMTDVTRLTAAGDSGQAGVVPGQPEASLLLGQITPDAAGHAEMPKGAKPLSAGEIDLIRRWIAGGAQDDSPASVGQKVDAEHPPVYSRQPVVTSLDFSPDGRLLAVSGFHEVLLFDVSEGRVPEAPLRRLVGLAERIERVRFSPDGTRLAVTGGNPSRMGEVQVWNVADGTLLRSVSVTFDTIFGGTWSPDGKQIAFGCGDNTLRAIDAETGVQVLHQGAHEDWVLDTVFSPQGDHVVSVGRDMTVKLTELATQRFVDNITSITPGALRGGLAAVDRHPRLEHVVAAGADGTPRVYRIHRHSPRQIGDDANLIFPLFPVTGRVFSVRFSPDGKQVAAVGSLDGRSELMVASYDFAEDVPKPVLDVMAKIPGDPVTRAGGQRSDADWKALDDYKATGTRLLSRVAIPETSSYSVAFNPVGGEVAVAGGDGRVRCFDPLTGSPTRSFTVARVDAAVAGGQGPRLPWPSEPSAEPEPPPVDGVVGLAVEPASITLAGPFAAVQLVVLGRYADGSTVDLTRTARIEPAAAIVSVAPGGLVRPLADGNGGLRVIHGAAAVEVPVTVAGATSMPHVDFVRDVNPVLSKLGCNQGTCHGAAKGKNGFKLSLRGYDPLFDVRAFTDDHAARRVNLASPDDSLMLLKASATAPHAGGLLAKPEESSYQVVRRWIEEGAALDPSAARVRGIRVFPPTATIDLPGRRQQFRVVAEYADGTTRDVTREAFLESGNTEVATADRQGLVTAVRRGEAPILARYEGSYAAVPLTVMGEREGFAWSQPESWNVVDDLVATKWQALKIVPAPLATDADFLRRVTLDLTGLPPSAADVRAFLADPRDPRTKRTELVHRLVGSDAFVEHWTNKWADLLQVNPKFLGNEGATALRAWIREQVAGNVPYDRFVREILTASGSNREHPAASYYKVLRDPLATMENTTHLFLGVRFNCNKCHDHPFERWTQDQYYETAAYFAQFGLQGDPESQGRTIGGTAVEGAKPLYEIVVDQPAGEVVHERTGKPVPPRFPFDCRFEAPEGATRRQQLAAWITAADNPYFATSYVNRLWGYLFGVGIIDPIDDIRAGNPATNPQLLAHLTRSFVDGGFDMRKILIEICTSRTYGLAIDTDRWNADDKINFSHALPRRLPAETLFDALHSVVGSPTRFPGYPVGTRAAQLPDVASALGGGFLQTFGRPVRESACECERAAGVALGPVMALVSGPVVGDVLADPQSDLAKLVAATPDDALLVDEVFVRILNRPARPEEVSAVKTLTAEIQSDNDAMIAELAAAEATWKVVRDGLEAERAARIAAATSALAAATAAYEPKRVELERQRADRIAAAVAAVEAHHADPLARLTAFESEAAGNAIWRIVPPADVGTANPVGRDGTTFGRLTDGSFLVGGAMGQQRIRYTSRWEQAALTGVRLEALADPRLPLGGSGRFPADGNFVITEVWLEVAPVSDPAAVRRVPLHKPQADFAQDGLPVALAVNDDLTNPNQGWAVSPRTKETHWAVFEPREPLAFTEPMLVTVNVEEHFNTGKHGLGRFRIAFTDAAGTIPLGVVQRGAELAAIPRDRRTPAEAAELDAIIRGRDGRQPQLAAELAGATQPLPPDPQLVALAAAVVEAEKPVPDDPAIVRLRADAAASSQQFANQRLTAIQDLAWALINSPAFFFNH